MKPPPGRPDGGFRSLTSPADPRRRSRPWLPSCSSTSCAVLLFEGSSFAAAEAFARADPYVTEGLVERWEVRGWTTVIDTTAAMPVR